MKAGVGYRRAHRAALLREGEDARPDVLEIIAGHFFADPPSIEPLARKYPVVFHEVGLSIGTDGDAAVSRAALGRVRALAEIAKPLLFSDHLAMTRSPSGVDLGHLAPLWYSHATLAKIEGRVRAWQDVLGVPIALENIAAPFVIQEADMTEPEFFTRLVEDTGCGMLLDVTNVLVNARNFGFDPAAELALYPLERVTQIHLAGGVRVDRDVWIDSHSAPVEDQCYALLAKIAPRLSRVEVVVVERDERLPSLAELVAEAKRAVSILQENR